MYIHHWLWWSLRRFYLVLRRTARGLFIIFIDLCEGINDFYMYRITQCIGESICRFCQVYFVGHYIEVQCIFEGHNRLALIYVYKLTLTDDGGGHIAIAVLQVFNDIRLYIAILLSRQDLITNDSLCTNTFFTTTFGLISSRSFWCTACTWWRHTNTAHWRRSHAHAIHRRRCTTRRTHRWRCHAYTRWRWGHPHSTWGRHSTNSTILSTTHGSILYSSIIYRSKAIGITTWRSKGVSTVSRCSCDSWAALL